MSPPPVGIPGLYLDNLASGFGDSAKRDEGADESASQSELICVAREAAFARLVAEHSGLMFRVAFSLLRNAQDAEDAVQEAFLKLYRGEAWRRMKNEKAFLARTVWRVALDRLPKGRERPLDSEAEPLSKDSDSPEASAMRAAHKALLRKMIDALPADFRRVLVLSALEELNSREIAEVLGIPEGTVRTRLMRAKEELRRRFEASSSNCGGGQDE